MTNHTGAQNQNRRKSFSFYTKKNTKPGDNSLATHSLPVDITNFFTKEVPEEDDKILIAFCDGSAINNGRPNCKCGYAIAWPYHPENNISELLSGHQQTNNRAEYMALIRTLMIADEIDPTKTKTLIVYTDSLLLINSLTKWVYDWKKNGWRKKDKNPVANVDLLMRLEEQREHRNLSLRHVKAHTGKPSWEARFNDKVDMMARKIVLDHLRKCTHDNENRKDYKTQMGSNENSMQSIIEWFS
jgi:ribonuclease HI